MGGAFYLKFYVEGHKAALDKIETISSSQVVNERFNALYAPLAQGGSRGYAIGRGRRDGIASQEQLAPVIEEIQQLYFEHFAEELMDDDDLILGDDADLAIENTRVSAESTDEALASLSDSSVLSDDSGENFETVRVAFGADPVAPVPKLAAELQARMLRWWHLPDLAYDPAVPSALFAYWENFVGLSLEKQPQGEQEYLFLFAGLLEEIIKVARPYLSASRRFRLAQVAGEVRRAKAAFPAHLEPFREAMAWRYLGVLAEEKKPQHVSPQEDPWLASLIRSAVSSRGSEKLLFDGEAAEELSPFEVWAFYSYYGEEGALDGDCERAINEAVVQCVLSLPKSEQAKANEGWKRALTSAKVMVEGIAATLAAYESEQLF